jgi:hypothetical protein
VQGVLEVQPERWVLRLEIRLESKAAVSVKEKAVVLWKVTVVMEQGKVKAEAKLES